MELVKTCRTFGLALAALAVGCSAAVAQTNYPERPIKLIVNYPAGGGSDSVGRLLAQKMGETIGQPVVVENKAGAATNIALETVAKAAPDGYTLDLATSNLAINPNVFPTLPFDPVKDFAPVSLVVKGLYALVINPSVPATSLMELVDYVKAHPGEIKAATAGIGTPGHLALAHLNATMETNITEVNYRGAAPAVTSVLGGETQMLFISLPSVAAHIEAGKLRFLAHTSDGPSPLAPGIPTATEAGVPGLEIYEWYGVVAPANTPQEIIQKLNAEIHKALQDPQMIESVTALGGVTAAGTPEEFAAMIASETARMKEIASRAGIQLE